MSLLAGMISFVFRFAIGAASVILAWVVLDNIHDRNTEIIVACFGLLYCFIYVISRRMQYYGLTVFSIFGVTISSLRNEPFDQPLRDEIGMAPRGPYVITSLLFTGVIELLCLFRLVGSLLGRWWDPVFEPVRAALNSCPILQGLLRAL